MTSISFNNVAHPVTKAFTTLHCTSPNTLHSTSIQFSTLPFL